MRLVLLLLLFVELHSFCIPQINLEAQCRSETTLLMKSKDGKSKKKKMVPAEEQNYPSFNPPRVMSRSNVSVRQQIAWVRAFKRLTSARSSLHSVPQKFRQQNEPAAPRPDEELVEFDFAKLKPPAIFVDGYNIIGYPLNLSSVFLHASRFTVVLMIQTENNQNHSLWRKLVIVSSQIWLFYLEPQVQDKTDPLRFELFKIIIHF
jgi:hypothetical protein